MSRFVPNVIVFSEAGAGGSSVINMLAGDKSTHISDGPIRTAFESTSYTKNIGGSTFRIIETVGLNEAPWSENPRDVNKGLFTLVRQVGDGISLLVHVVRAHSIPKTAQKNYRMFFDAICQGQVPIVVVVTGLEDRDDMDMWWFENESSLKNSEMNFDGYACITARKGKCRNGRYLFESEYEMSRKKVETLILEKHRPDPWKTALPLDAIRARIPDFPRKCCTANVILFGETGAGKSSVVNMLEGGSLAKIGDQAAGVTFTNTPYEKTIFGSSFRVFDTVGLNEGPRETGLARKAIEGLYTLIRELDGGVNLLVYVMRAGPMKMTAKNYKMFFEVLCQKEVPIVIIITGLETRIDMDGWWEENENSFHREGMLFKGHACITAFKGLCRSGKYLFEEEYDKSKKLVEELIYDSYGSVPWKMPTSSWLDVIFVKMQNAFATLFGMERVPDFLSMDACRALRDYEGLSK